MILQRIISQHTWLLRKALLEKGAAENAFFAEVWQSQKDFADIAVPFWAGRTGFKRRFGQGTC